MLFLSTTLLFARSFPGKKVPPERTAARGGNTLCNGTQGRDKKRNFPQRRDRLYGAGSQVRGRHFHRRGHDAPRQRGAESARGRRFQNAQYVRQAVHRGKGVRFFSFQDRRDSQVSRQRTHQGARSRHGAGDSGPSRRECAGGYEISRRNRESQGHILKARDGILPRIFGASEDAVRGHVPAGAGHHGKSRAQDLPRVRRRDGRARAQEPVFSRGRRGRDRIPDRGPHSRRTRRRARQRLPHLRRGDVHTQGRVRKGRTQLFAGKRTCFGSYRAFKVG